LTEPVKDPPDNPEAKKAREIDAVLDGARVVVGPMGREPEPERQPPWSPGELEREVARVAAVVDVRGAAPSAGSVTVPIAAPITATEHLEVPGALTVSSPRGRRVAVDERTRVVGREEPLVRIDDEAVGVLDTRHARSQSLRQEAREAIRAIHVEPPRVLARDGGDARQVVDRTSVRRPDRRDECDHACGRGHVDALDPRGERITRQASGSIRWDRDEFDVHHARRGCDAAVHLLRGEHDAADR
jgi:hypothetical protein